MGADRLKGILGKLREGNIAGVVGTGLLGTGAGKARMPGSRRSKNPANVKALRRALSRVEGFGKLVKRVNKMLPSSHRFTVHPVMKHKRKRKP
jgi:hypothetical protein